MESFEEKEWKAFPVSGLFDRFEPGRGNGLGHLTEAEPGYGVQYIGATDRNDGVLCFVDRNEETEGMIQPGNCVGFIKNGDGSAGYAVYKEKEFISTSDVIFGYAGWLNRYTGLFFVAAQNMTEGKYSHGYKRNMRRLLADRVMLPVTDAGDPDFGYMDAYMKRIQEDLYGRYAAYARDRLSVLGKRKGVPGLSEKKWAAYPIESLFAVSPGKRLTAADMKAGDRPFIGATAENNGVTAFCGNKNASLDRNVLGVNYNGSIGYAFYHPYECVFSDDVKRFHLKGHEDNVYVLLFMAAAIGKQRGKFGYAYKFNAERMGRTRILVPVTDAGEPDYGYMEQYMKNLMIEKYEGYLRFAGKTEF